MKIWIVFLLTILIHAVDTSSFAARLAGVRTGRLMLSSSLYNALALVSRGANTLAGPLIALMTDLSAKHQQTGDLLRDFRLLLLAATIGTLISGLSTPTLSRILASGVLSYERKKSLPGVIIQGATIRGFWRIRQNLQRPRWASLRQSRSTPIPLWFLIVSIIITAFFTVGNFAALYASALVPEGARTAVSLAPLLTGLAVFANLFVISPYAALIVDEALRGERKIQDVTFITIWQISARLAGTVFAQLLIGPMGNTLATLTKWLVPA